MGVPCAQFWVQPRARYDQKVWINDLLVLTLHIVARWHGDSIAIVRFVRKGFDLVKLQVVCIGFGAEGCSHLLHRTHLLHLVDNLLLSEVVEVADNEGAEGRGIFLQLAALLQDLILKDWPLPN